jgi:hypothetical protein
MAPEQLYRHLEDLAEQLGILIRYENLSNLEPGAASGLCRVKGSHLFLMDSSKPLSEKIRALSQCLSRMELEGIYLLPAVRRVLEENRGGELHA